MARGIRPKGLGHLWVPVGALLLIFPSPLMGQTGALVVEVRPNIPGIRVVLEGTRRTAETDDRGLARFSRLTSQFYFVSAAVSGTTRRNQVVVRSTGPDTVVLEFPFARIQVSTNSGAAVTLDQSEPRTANARGIAVFDNVRPGGHAVTARMSGYVTGSRQVAVGNGDLEIVSLRLSPSQPQPPAVEQREEANPVNQSSNTPAGPGPALPTTGELELRVDRTTTVEIRSARGTRTVMAYVGQPNLIRDLPPGTVTLILRGGASLLDTLIVPIRAGFTRQIDHNWESGAASGRITTQQLLFVFLAVNAVLGALLFVVLRRRRLEVLPPDVEMVTGRFDEYMVVATLGRGGMATVYRARAPSGEMVAVKVMDRELRNDTDLLTKFLREGRVLQTINERYPAVPVVRALRYGLEDGQADGRPFIALEYLEGVHLLEFLRSQDNRLSPEKAAEIVGEIARGLEGAHACGVFHRDLTPDNVIILKSPAPTGILKLIDFGVAKHEFTSVHTLDGSIFGKPPYMAPEQCRGGTIDGRTDLYALGVIYYLLLTGRTPFADRNPLAVMKMHESAPVPALPNSVDATTRAIVYRLLEKKPNSRFQEASELLTAVSIGVQC